MDEGKQTSGEGQLLNQIHEKMRVYDRDNNDIGMVDRVYLGAASDQAYEHGEGPATADNPDYSQNRLYRDVAQVFEPDNLPEELRERLTQRGFVRIAGSGILAADRYILPEQIDRVADNHVYLNVLRKELIKS